jgi:hypothetical protein
MAEQRRHRRFHLDKPVPYTGRKRVKKKRARTLEDVPEGWSTAISNRVPRRQRVESDA